MKKITFNNGQAPYINDTNLNQMQDNIEEAVEKSCIFVKENEIQVTTTQESEIKALTLTSQNLQRGNKFTLENGAITVGEGVTAVRVSVMANIASQSDGSTYQRLQVMKNNEAYGLMTTARNNKDFASNHSLTLLMPVKQGDVISLTVFNRLPGTLLLTYVGLTVEEI